jgi:hypothetical protein
MTRDQRTAHRIIWCVIPVILIAMIVVALVVAHPAGMAR